ncbi:hypothetical protein OIO90_000925 [Microbotryomycetes sp. JL221]|nr:hypothetical protein OIO90_000925 [Microbotryomycetes sp. JL221]
MTATETGHAKSRATPRAPAELTSLSSDDMSRAPSSSVSTLDDTTYPPRQSSSVAESAAPTRAIPSLPPPDHGKQAMLFLASAFVVETVVWGVPSSYGVLLAYYEHHGVSGGVTGGQSSILLPLTSTFAAGLMYFLGPPIALLLNARPRWRQTAIRTGSVVCFLGLLTSSFSKEPWHLLLSQGLLYSIGGAFVYYPTFSYLSEWFVARRGFANGCCFAGTAAGGLVYPFIMDALLQRFGPGVTMRSLRLWRNRRLLIFLGANVAQSIAFFVITLYLPSFADSIGLSGAQGSAMLAAVNASAVISRVGIGIASDRMSPHIIGACTLSSASLAVLILWGVASTSFAPLLVFSLLLGLVAGGWTSLYASVIQEAAKDDNRLASTLFGLVSFTRGLGSILTAPISSYLITHSLKGASPSTAYGVAGGKYGSLVLCVGLVFSVAAMMELIISLSRKPISSKE